jgi:signal transduction histidine kinase
VTALADIAGRLARATPFRLALLAVAVFVAAAALAALSLIWQTNTLLTDQVLRALRGERDELMLAAEVRGLEALVAMVGERSRSVSGTLYFLADTRGIKLAGNLSRHPPEFTKAHPGGVFTYASAVRGNGERMAAGLTTPTPGGANLVLARDIEDQRRLLDGMRRIAFWSFAGLALTGLLGGLGASWMLQRRIEDVNVASRSIMAGDLSQRIPLAGTGDEIDDLAVNLNAMLARIEQLMTGMREVSDNIAHDLKTPLNRLRSRAEAALRDDRGGPAWREGLERTIEDADELIKTFNALLLIARLEAGAVDQSFEAFDIAEAVRDLAELYEPVAEEAQLALAVSCVPHLQVRANRELIGQAVANLVDNAIKYAAAARTPDPIRISVAQTPAGVEISVADRGPGIAAGDRQRALRRFVRLDDSRSKPGSGLGLSLVAAVARLHGGSVRLDDNDPGLKATLALPARLVVSRGPDGGIAPSAGTEREDAHAGSG